MEIKDLRTKSQDELLKMVSELKGKLLALRFENATGQLAETHLIKETKRNIARVFTVLKEMEAGNTKATKATVKAEATPEAKTTSDDLSSKNLTELKAIAKDAGIKGFSTLKKDELIKAIEEAK
jgi:large subunit ribosomal protein L29